MLSRRVGKHVIFGLTYTPSKPQRLYLCESTNRTAKLSGVAEPSFLRARCSAGPFFAVLPLGKDDLPVTVGRLLKLSDSFPIWVRI